MEDIIPIKARHGHYDGKGFWWIDHALIDKKPVSFMIMFGSKIIGDKACYRLGTGPEVFYEPASPNRDTIIRQGKQLIRELLKKATVKAIDGSPYDWDTVLPR